MNISRNNRKRISRSISAENFRGEKGKGGMATEGTGAFAARNLGQKWKVSPSVVIPSGESFTLADIEGPGVIRHIWITQLEGHKKLIIRFYWDGDEKPAIECPVGDFFACGLDTFGPVDSDVVTVNPKAALSCWWEMPFRRNCRIELENRNVCDATVYYQINYTLEEVPKDSMYLHAFFNKEYPHISKEDYVILPRIETEGCYAGTYMTWGVHNTGWWGEGEVKMYYDGDDEYPTYCGTGTEDYFLGSWNFEDYNEHVYREFSSRYSGMPVIERPDGTYHSQTRFSLYRWHTKDPVWFDNDMRVTIQTLGWKYFCDDAKRNEYLVLRDDLSSVAFFYSKDTSIAPLPSIDRIEELENF